LEKENANIENLKKLKHRHNAHEILEENGLLRVLMSKKTDEVFFFLSFCCLKI